VPEQGTLLGSQASSSKIEKGKIRAFMRGVYVGRSAAQRDHGDASADSLTTRGHVA
jgi:hypothetical protein